MRNRQRTTLTQTMNEIRPGLHHTRRAYSVEKLQYWALTSDFAEWYSGFLRFWWYFWAHFDERRTAFYFLKICKRSKEFFNTIGGEWSFAAVRVEDCFSGLGDRQSAIVIHSVLPGWAEPSPLDRKSPVTEATINSVRVGISRSGMSEVVSFMKSKMV
jgi:hypothetical protein